ncbi:FkbM family methyltransferase [Vibrio sp. TBV020]|uniref:FkbM family methyltransferase n=1 Tax=Vibrio sp. TBV020 TaxID=3137398 RepID=UPI0038CD8379
MKFNYKGRIITLMGYSKDDHIYRTIVNTKSFYEVELLEYIIKVMKNRAPESIVCVDVGANIGNHSVFLGSFISEHVVAVEPNPDVLPLLKCNLEINAISHTLFPVALGESEGFGELTIPLDENIGSARLNELEQGTVPITSFDTLFTDWKLSHPEFKLAIIKIDVEGMELKVLKGAVNTLISERPELFIEAASRYDYFKLAKHLGSLGYYPISCWGATPMYHFSCRSSVENIKMKGYALERKAINVFHKLRNRLGL